ncbi:MULTISPECIES: DEAD/DEAH box helicase [Paenibacillus]|uniref:DEAD/DEAH box helicase n=1 Tax=Paenibacillus urinalis TaxID=521520 RepID=A0ABY7XHH8_9BACL|nr:MULTISPECIES: DEAD/DEAH box helicase [Paenibacillus]WDI05252.1 DEAD/DEAH box helicase [Paenibacillus urinalis]
MRSQYDNVYIKILDNIDTFEYTLSRVRSLPGRAFNMETGEWMISRDNVGALLFNFNNQIIWMTPLNEIVAGLDIYDEIVQKHLQWESETEFKKFKLLLYPYQKVGANFLLDRGSAAVFDGCGLGKTPQLIGAFEKIFERGGKRGLIVTLNSLKRQWAKEIEKFTGKPAIPVTGTSKQREKLIRGFASHKKTQYLVINYEILRDEKLRKLITSIPFDAVGLDEAQKIKNGVTDTFLDLKPSQIASATYELKYIPHRFIATATPMQGKAEEVWSLFYFVNEHILGDWYAFRERYCEYSKRYGITGYKELGELYYRIAPYFIRRTKENPEVQQQLPKVTDDPIFLDMTDKQAQLHDYLLDKYMEVKETAKKISSSPDQYHFIAGKSMSKEEAKEYYDALAQGYQIFMLSACDSPQLLTMSDSSMAQGILKDISLSEKDLKSPKVDHIVQFYEQMLYDEPKSKVVIFTQFARMAELIHSKLKQSVVFHGKMNDNAKEFAKEQFVNNPNIKAIVCTDAGSTGLNLQVANYMIHADLPWDPTLVEQRNGRIDRTGNKFSNINIYYLIMNNGYDEHLLNILERKSSMANTVIDGGKSTASSKNISKLAMENMIKERKKSSQGLVTVGG